MQVDPVNSAGGLDRREVRLYLGKLFNRRDLNEALALCMSKASELDPFTFVAFATALKPFCNSSDSLLTAVAATSSQRAANFAHFLGGTQSIFSDGDREVGLHIYKADLQLAYRHIYYAALVDFVAATKKLGIEINVHGDFFAPLFTSHPKNHSPYEILRSAGRMIFLSTATEYFLELAHVVFLGTSDVHTKVGIDASDLKDFVDSAYQALRFHKDAAAEMEEAITGYLSRQLGRGDSATSLVVSASPKSCQVRFVTRDIIGDVKNIVRQLFNPRGNFIVDYGSAVLFERRSEEKHGRTLLGLLDPSFNGHVSENVLRDVTLVQALKGFNELAGDGARLVRALEFITSIRNQLGATNLSVSVVDFALREFGEESVVGAILLADGLAARYGIKFRNSFLEPLSRDSKRAFSQLMNVCNVLEELKLSIAADESYFQVGYLAHQMLAGALEKQVVINILSLRGDSIPHLFNCVDAMIPSWREGRVPKTPKKLEEQIKKYGYLGVLVDWACSSKSLISQAYTVLNRHFELEYRRIIRRLDQSTVPAYRWLEELKNDFVHVFTVAHVQGRFLGTQLESVAQQFLKTVVKVDSPPYPLLAGNQRSTDYEHCYAESVATMFSALSIYYGQGALMFAARRSAPERMTTIQQFAGDCCKSHHVVSGNKDQYPGSGIVMQGLRPESVWPENTLANDGASDSSFLTRVFKYLGDSSLCLFRGGRIVIPAESHDFSVFRRPLALLAFQDHFGDPNRLGVMLVSAQRAWGLIDEMRRGWTFSSSKDILAFVRERDCNFNLTSISCLGGLCNSAVVGSSPLWGWEGRTENVYAMRDFAGHVHKYYGVGARNPEWSKQDVSAALRQFADAHDKIFDVSSKLFEIELAWRVAMQRYNLGHYYGTIAGENIYNSPVFEGGLAFPDFGFRMLVQAMRWHVDLKAKGVTDVNSYPVVVVANPLDHWGAPSSRLRLDTSNMTIFDGDDHHQIETPTMQFSDSERDISARIRPIDKLTWRLRLWEPAEAQGFELRLEDRRRLI